MNENFSFEQLSTLMPVEKKEEPEVKDKKMGYLDSIQEGRQSGTDKKPLKDDDNQGVEQAESSESEKSTDARYAELRREKEDIRFEREMIHNLDGVLLQGVQSLINEYGSEKVLQAISGNSKDTLTVLREIEPNIEKRRALYERMPEETMEAKNDYLKTFADPNHKDFDACRDFQSTYDENFVTGVSIFVGALKRADTRIGTLFNKRFEGIPGMHPMSFVSVNIHYEDDLKAITEEFKVANDNFFQFIESRRKVNKEKEDEWISRAKDLSDDFYKEMQNIVDGLNFELEEYRNLILDKLNEIGDLEGEEISAEQDKALEEAHDQMIKKTEEMNQKISEIKKSYECKLSDLSRTY